MNTSRSTDSGTTMFKTLQHQFVNWTARWVKTGDTIEQQPIDLPQLVQLLQALGFYIRRMDGCLPNETSPLRDSQRGIRIIATCNHSGHRCYLEQPLNENMCKCLNIFTDDSKETYWEIVATKPSSNQEASVVETGSDLIPPISKELKEITYSVINYLIHMIQANGDPKSESVVAAGDTAEKEAAPKRYSDQYYAVKCPIEYTPVKAASSMYDFTEKPAVVSTPYILKGTDSPTRYRSLDTLTSKGDDSWFPEPGKLHAMYSISESETVALSSSNTQLSVEDIVGESKSTIGESQPSFKAVSLMKNAARDLIHAISLMEANIADISFNSVFETPLKESIKSAKSVSYPSKSPLTSRSVSSPSLSKSSSLTIRSLQGKSPKLPAKSISSASIKTGTKTKKIENKPVLKRSESASNVGDCKTKIAGKTDFARQAIKRTTNLYAHVKSTIPKPGFSKKM